MSAKENIELINMGNKAINDRDFEALEMELAACKARNKKYLDFIKKFSNEILGED